MIKVGALSGTYDYFKHVFLIKILVDHCHDIRSIKMFDVFQMASKVIKIHPLKMYLLEMAHLIKWVAEV